MLYWSVTLLAYGSVHLSPAMLASNIVPVLARDDAGAVDAAMVLSDDDMVGGCLPSVQDILGELTIPPQLSPLPIYPRTKSQGIGTSRVRRVTARGRRKIRKSCEKKLCI